MGVQANSTKQSGDGIATVGAHRREEVRNGDGVGDDLLCPFVGFAVGSAMRQPTSGENATEGAPLVPTSAAAIEFRGSTKFRCDENKRFVEESLVTQVFDESGERLIELSDQLVLI